MPSAPSHGKGPQVAPAAHPQLPPVPAGVAINTEAGLIFNGLNADKTGGVSLTDLDTALHLKAGHEPQPILNAFNAVAGADHVISLPEVTTALTAADANGDHLISMPELAHSGLGLLGHGPVGHTPPPPPSTPIATASSHVLAALDTDHSGGVSLAEFDAALHLKAGHEPQPLLNLFKALDADHNGQVGGAEITAALTAADANHDGAVTAAELAHAPIGLVGAGLLHHDHLI